MTCRLRVRESDAIERGLVLARQSGSGIRKVCYRENYRIPSLMD